MPKHKFDMEALLSHVQRDEAAKASTRRVAEMLSEEKDDTSAAAKGAKVRQKDRGLEPSAAFYDTIMDVLPERDGEDNQVDHERVMRAVKRTEAAAARKRWYFFDRSSGSQQPPRTPFPSNAAKGRWRFLAPTDSRKTDLARGLASTLLLKGHELPDELFLWLLDEVGRETDAQLSREYVHLLSLCHDQVQQHIDESSLHRLFLQVGATAEALDPAAKLKSIPEPDELLSSGKDWNCLRSLLRLLSSVAGWLTFNTLTCAVGIFLRLGIDPVIHRNVDIFKEYSEAIENLLLAVLPEDWDAFCEEIASSLYCSVDEATLWWDAISVLPSGEPRFQEFRRRLAMVFFFDDLPRGREHPEDTFSIRAVIDRLESSDEFIVDRETDYYELSAYIYLLNVVVDDGSPAVSDSRESEQQFNADVDDLTKMVKNLEQKVPQGAGGYSSRLEARAILGAVRSRLPYAVRVRPPPKKDIYSKGSEEDDTLKPRQQLFMRKFLKKDKRLEDSKPLGEEAKAQD